jgi:hypothetical protein
MQNTKNLIDMMMNLMFQMYLKNNALKLRKDLNILIKI